MEMRRRSRGSGATEARASAVRKLHTTFEVESVNCGSLNGVLASSGATNGCKLLGGRPGRICDQGTRRVVRGHACALFARLGCVLRTAYRLVCKWHDTCLPYQLALGWGRGGGVARR